MVLVLEIILRETEVRKLEYSKYWIIGYLVLIHEFEDIIQVKMLVLDIGIIK
jgi:hypothetical protein